MPLLEDNKCKISDRDIYLELDKFKKIGGECNVAVSDRLLEAYERHGLLYPSYRIIRPREYLQALFEQHYGSDRCRNVIEVPDEYGALLKFEHEELRKWHHPICQEFDKALTEGHPLDQAYARGDPFIQRPSKEIYKNWDEYHIVLEITTEGNVIRDTDTLARHFYSPWQIYLLDEANRKYTRRINLLIAPGEGERYNCQEEPRELELAKWATYFRSLWEYRFKKTLLFAKALEGVQRNILEGTDLERFNNDTGSLASDISAKYSYDLWIKFLQALCELYFDYRKREKYRLSECMRKDIRCLIDLLMHGSGKAYRDLIDAVGMVLGGGTYLHVPPLERIYPEYESFIKREAQPVLASVLMDYNAEGPECLKLSDDGATDQVIDHAFTSGNETLLVSVIGVNREYFSPSYFGDEGIWSFIRSLSVAVESWVKAIAGQDDFGKAIGHITKGDFDSCCDKLKKSCGKTNMKVHSYSDLKQFLNALPTTQFKRCGKDLSWMKYIVRAYLIRNYAAHHTRLDPELFGRNLIELYKSLLFLLFYAWAWKVKPQP